MQQPDPVQAEHRHTLTLDSSSGAAGEASVWIRTLCEQHAVRAEWMEGLDLCSVELVANVADYAYDGEPGEIQLHFCVSDRRAELTVEDTGPEFNPLNQERPRIAHSLEDAQIGGFGIHLVREFAQECHYERMGGINQLTVVFGEPRPKARQVDRRQRNASAFPTAPSSAGVVVENQRASHDRRALGFISRTELFRNVPYDELERIVANCKIVAYRTGDLILAAGLHSQRVWVVIEGSLRVHFDGPDSEDSLDIPCGECVGEISVADGKLSTAWVVAASACSLLEIDAETFVERLLSIPKVGRNLVMILAERMRRSNQRISDRVRMETELKALQRELDFARRIQASMLPLNPLLAGEPRLDCHGFMRAARQVGGDFYDALPLDKDRYLIAIGDVCNKGMPAALFMAQTLAMLRSMAMQGTRDELGLLAKLATRGNDQLCQMNSEQLFVSIFLAVIDLEKGELRYVNAGHNPPLLWRPGESPLLIDSPRNPVAGMVPGIQYRSANVLFPNGSLLLLYTDGVTEAEEASLGQFGEDSLMASFSQAHASADSLVSELVKSVDAFAAGHPQADDITLLAVRRCQ